MAHMSEPKGYFCFYCEIEWRHTRRDIQYHENICRKRLAEQQTSAGGSWPRLLRARVDPGPAGHNSPPQPLPAAAAAQQEMQLQEQQLQQQQQGGEERQQEEEGEAGDLPSPAASWPAPSPPAGSLAAANLQPHEQPGDSDTLDVPVSDFARQHCGFGGYQGQRLLVGDDGDSSDSEDEGGSAGSVHQALASAGGQPVHQQHQLSFLTSEEQALVPVAAILPAQSSTTWCAASSPASLIQPTSALKTKQD